ncbi:aminotransferase class V-fold PLP-dependent enzyme [Egibacter rhizosphaerae]|uniref:Tritium exchange subunit n=1 Tax=Egibacter rhizosphaerae TaxID=1670831 RepID=A0A411YJV6_9ACTN|nr:aminotransferase class V-fold PLP-dependent enzyme [Egibacter rhizosphaerae]QBI21489.1 aminotransferase class V-fold PLP-dependent enzyme [Egibacter rhizosphaerae]
MAHRSGRHFLQIPGPTNVPDRVLRAIDRPTIDHRGPSFGRFAQGVLADIRSIFRTEHPVVTYPSSGTGAWEAALVNTLSPGDRVLMYETGHFAVLWRRLAERLGLVVDLVEGDWRSGADPAAIEARLAADTGHEIKAVAVVHNETSTGATSRLPDVRAALDRTGHPALLLADTVSSLGSIDYRHDEWGVDVAVAASQKGLLLPPGLGLNAISEKARAASSAARLPRAYWDWEDMLAANARGFFPYTPATSLLYGLREAIDLLHEEGLEAVFARHRRHAAATRAAVEAWGLEVVCRVPAERSAAVTAAFMPGGEGADHVREIALERFDLSLGAGLGALADRVFRIGHLGDFNDLMLQGTLSGVEMSLELAGVELAGSGVRAAADRLAHGDVEVGVGT